MSQKENVKNDQMNDILKFIYEILRESKLSEKVKRKLVNELEHLKAFTLDARPARIAIVGRRGSGKSSLINAIFGEMRAEIGDVKARTGMGKWHTYQSDSGNLEILDTRGLGEADKPEEESLQKSAIKEVQASIIEKCPDVILFLCKAKEVSSRIDEDLSQLLELKETIQAEHDYDVPIIGVVTQVDELSPKSADKPPFDHPVKQKNIADATDVLSVKLRDKVSNPVNVIPVCCYVEFEGNEMVYDIRWNVDHLVDYLIEQLPNEAQMVLAKLSKIKSIQKKLARRIGSSIAGATGLIGASPIPGPDLPIVTGLQMMMVTTIARISGNKTDKRTVMKFLSALGLNVGAGFAFRQLARQLLKVIPGAGSAVSGLVASAGTYALCEAAIAYFIEEYSIEKVRETYKNIFKSKKNEAENE